MAESRYDFSARLEQNTVDVSDQQIERIQGLLEDKAEHLR